MYEGDEGHGGELVEWYLLDASPKDIVPASMSVSASPLVNKHKQNNVDNTLVQRDYFLRPFPSSLLFCLQALLQTKTGATTAPTRIWMSKAFTSLEFARRPTVLCK